MGSHRVRELNHYSPVAGKRLPCCALRTRSQLVRLVVALICAGTTLLCVRVHAQSLEQGLQLFKDKDYPAAAVLLYDVVSAVEDPAVHDKAEIFLAETLFKMELHLPALLYYADVFRAPDPRYYVNAAQGLLKIQEALHDRMLVPAILNENIDGQALSRLPVSRREQINFLIGELSYRQRKFDDVQEFIATFKKPQRALYAKAKMILALSYNLQGNTQEALRVFREIALNVDVDDPDPEKRHVRSLALIGAARIEYGLGNYAKATRFYRAVPRFTAEWFTALYENSWSYFQQEAYGKALGEVQSVRSPYFARRHVPETYVVAATTYFINCQWDRTREEIKRYKKIYTPMKEGLRRYLDVERPSGAYYRDIVRGGTEDLSIDLVRDVRRQRRFVNFDFVLRHATWQKKEILNIVAWRGTAMRRAALSTLAAYTSRFETEVGNWVNTQLTQRYLWLKNFENQIDLLDLETTSKETDWLAAGEEILKGRRSRLPRPTIPNDQWQHWSFNREYWKDELGYIEHTLRSECFNTSRETPLAR